MDSARYNALDAVSELFLFAQPCLDSLYTLSSRSHSLILKVSIVWGAQRALPQTEKAGVCSEEYIIHFIYTKIKNIKAEIVFRYVT